MKKQGKEMKQMAGAVKGREDTTQWLCEMALSDSEPALRSLYLAYHLRLIRFVQLYVHSTSEAEEVVSDIFLAIWNNRKTLPGITNFDAYIYTVARNKAISHLRTGTVENIEFSEDMIDLFLHTETTPEQDLISKECTDRLNQAINSLPGKCKLAFKLVREDKLKYKEVAAILNISVKTLEAHIATAVKKLREILMSEIVK